MWKFPKYEINKPINWDSIEENYSWFQDMKGVPQDKIWHAEGDVFIHTKMVVEALVNLAEFKELEEQEKHIIFTATLMHDIEKRSTTTTEEIEGVLRIVSPRHAKKGEITSRNILYKDFQTPFRIREEITKLVRLHGLPIWAIQKKDPNKEVIFSSLHVNTKLLYIIAKADILGRICTDQEDILYRIEMFKELCLENDCFGKAKIFKSNLSRFQYLNKENSFVDYVPFDDIQFEVTVMCALPGSGKDTYIKKYLDDLPMLSLDEIRREKKIKYSDKKGNGQVIQLAKEQAKVFMRAKQSFVFNATNLTKDMRNKWISLFLEYNSRIKIIYIEVPYKQLISQNRNREFKLPEKAIEKLLWKLEMPSLNEAHYIEYYY